MFYAGAVPEDADQVPGQPADYASPDDDERRERQYRFIADTEREDEESREELATEMKRIRRLLGARRRQAAGNGTFQGRPLDDDYLAELGAEAEQGYDVDEILRRRGAEPASGGCLGTVSGRPVTEADVQAMVANAEAGFPGVTVRWGGVPGAEG